METQKETSLEMQSGSYEVLFKVIERLTSEDLAHITALYLEYYDGSSEEQVVEDLQSKSEILLLLYDGRLVGFTTYELYDVVYISERRRVIYSGDTVVAQAHWGQQHLAMAWAKRLGEFYRALDGVPFYWFLIVKGHRTFRYMPAFVHSFYPHWSYRRDDLKAFVDYLARDKFAQAYDEELGIIHFPTSQGELKSDYATASPRELKHPAVAFFLERNPNYSQGDELVCICEIKEQNFKPLTKRWIVGK